VRSGTSNFAVVTTRLPGAGLRPPPTPVTVTHKKRKKNVDAVTVCFLALCCIVELYTLIYQKWPPIRAVIGVDYRYNGNVSQLIRPVLQQHAWLHCNCAACVCTLQAYAIPFCSVSATPYRVCYCAPDAGLCCMLLRV